MAAARPRLRANRLVLPCAARSLRYASVTSSYASSLADAASLASSRSRSNSDAVRSSPRTVRSRSDLGLGEQVRVEPS